MVLLPLWLQQFMGYTATDAGMVHGAGRPARDHAVAAGRQDRAPGSTRARYATFAFVVFALVLWMRSHFNTQADFATILIPTIIQGVAMAFFFIPLVDASPCRASRPTACRRPRA